MKAPLKVPRQKQKLILPSITDLLPELCKAVHYVFKPLLCPLFSPLSLLSSEILL